MFKPTGSKSCELAEHVVVGACGTDGLGCSALLALEPSPASVWTAEITSMNIAADPVPSITFSVINFRGSDGLLKVSLVVPAMPILQKQEADVCNSLFDMLMERPGSLPILVATSLPLSGSSSVPYVWDVRGGAVLGGLAGLPVLPSSTPIRDSLVALMSHMALAKGVPTCCIAVPAASGAQGEGGDSAELEARVRPLGKALAGVLGLQYSSERAQQVKAAGCCNAGNGHGAAGANRDSLMYS